MTNIYHSTDISTTSSHLDIKKDQWSNQEIMIIDIRSTKCNVPDPLTGEEDATNSKHTGKHPHEHEHEYNAEIKILNIIHTKMHNPSYT